MLKMNAEDPEVPFISRNSRIQCCVVRCHNSYYNTDESVKFYTFPKKWFEKERRQIWINRVRRVCDDGEWQPKYFHRICSSHFVGNLKSNVPDSPSYNPTIFPKEYKKVYNSTKEIDRYQRKIARCSRRDMPNEGSLVHHPIVCGDENHSMDVEEELNFAMENKKNSRRYSYCSVPQCSSKSSENVSFHRFPKIKSLAAEWKRLLRIERPVSQYMIVCSLHFKRTDFFLPDVPAKRRCLKRGVIPSKNLPRGHTDKRRTTKKSLCRKKCNVEDSQDREAAEALLSFINPQNNPEVECNNGTDHVIPEKMLLTSKFRTIAVQTESTNVFDDVNKDEDIQQVNFSEYISHLRKSFVGRALKIGNNSFRINECTISFTKENQDKEKKETLVIQTDKVVSSCELFSDSLFDSERNPKACLPKKNLKDFNKEVRILMHKLPEGLVEAAKNGHLLKIRPNEEIEKKGNHQPKNLFKIKVLSGVPQELLSVKKLSCSGHKELIDDGNVPQSSDLDNREKNVKDNSCTSKSSSEGPERIQNSIEIVEQDIEEMSDNRKNGFMSDKTDQNSRYRIEDEDDGKQANPINYESVETCPECSTIFQNEKKLERHLLENHHVVLKKDNYPCDNCPKQFITYRSLIYHKKTLHNLDTVEDIILKLKCDNCNKLFEVNYFKHIHLFECTEKLEKQRKQNNNDIKDSMELKLAAIASKPVVIKRKSSFISSRNHNVQGKKCKLNEETAKYSIGETCTDIFSKLEVLMGIDDGPNKVTIVDLDE